MSGTVLLYLLPKQNYMYPLAIFRTKLLMKEKFCPTHFYLFIKNIKRKPSVIYWMKQNRKD